MSEISLVGTPEWQALESHAKTMRSIHMRELFENDPDRFDRFSFKLGPLLADYSKNILTLETGGLLLELARACRVDEGRGAMFAGAPINSTERRAALHAALRRKSDEPLMVGGQDVMSGIRVVRERIKAFAEEIRSGKIKGSSGKAFKHIINIGIGGSHIGPMFVAQALESSEPSSLTVEFVSNIDSAQFNKVAAALDPEATLVVICSKTFTTSETMANAAHAKAWLAKTVGAKAVSAHFAAVSTAADKATAFGVSKDRIFPIWDWVGGRYSLWSAMSLSAVLARGYDAFDQMLAGAEAMDKHFETAPLSQNLPVILAMIGVWNINFLDFATHAILPYDHALRGLPAHIQQLDMESNGKGVTVQGAPVTADTGPIVFGGGGSDSQHSFFQLLHQGPRVVPCDFIAAISGAAGSDNNRDVLLSNVFGQSEALLKGRNAAELENVSDELKAHKTFPGNRPSNTLLLDEISPYAVGMLLALYEHKVYVQSLIWGINAFDQWGVELGKELAKGLEPALSGNTKAVAALSETGNGSTIGLVNAYLAAKNAAS